MRHFALSLFYPSTKIVFLGQAPSAIFTALLGTLLAYNCSGMRAAASASTNVEFGKQWQGQAADGRFPLEQYLGGSDQAGVFLTRLQDKSNNKAAIKLLPAGPDADSRLADWRRAAGLSHPHLVRIFESGRCWLSGKELLYVVSEYGDENLAQVVPQRALTNEEADAMLRPAIAALAYLHDRGLVHGHIHPSNVMAVNDELKLSSDGIRATGSTPQKSEASAYDAPEVATGQPSLAADIWSLGAMLVEALSRRMPAGKVGSDVGMQPPYAEIVRHCLVKNPASRWTARDIAGAIQLELPPRSADTQPNKKTDAVRSPSAENRPRLLMPVLALVALIAAVLAIVLTVRVFQHAPKPVPQSAPAQPAAESQAPAQPASPAANSSAEVLHQVLPDPSVSARNTIHGRIKVRVQVTVDRAGNVSNARFLSSGPSKYFSRLAMEAAQQWKFRPAAGDGQASPREWNLLFEFTRGGVQAAPQQVKASR
jgi:TonB family protein